MTKPTWKWQPFGVNCLNCKRKKVGALIVKETAPLFPMDTTGLPLGLKMYVKMTTTIPNGMCCMQRPMPILKVAASTQSCKGATLYITLSPCRECSKLIHQSGITRVVYAKEYKDTSGLEFLKKAGVALSEIPLNKD